MTTGILILAIVGVLAALSHRRSRLEERIYKDVPVADWLLVLVFPVLFYLGWVLLVRNILDRANIDIFPLSDFDILAITILFIAYGFAGNGIHFTGKIIWRYMHGYEHTKAYQINELFHGKLGHYLSFLNSLFIASFLPVLEINHPLALAVSAEYMAIIIIAGTAFGMSANKAIYYTNEWFGGYNKPLVFIETMVIILLFALIRSYKLNFAFYPVTLFITTVLSVSIISFMARQFFIFARLGKRRKLRFLAKILSV